MAIPSSGQPEDVPGTPSTTEPAGPVLGAVDPPAGPVTAEGDSTTEDAAAGSATTDSTPGRAARRDAPKKGGPLAFLRELPALLLIAFVLALLIKSFLVQAFYIPSESMVPTLKVGDRVLVNKLTYRFHPPGRGDIIVFEDSERAADQPRSRLRVRALGDRWARPDDQSRQGLHQAGHRVARRHGRIRRGNVFINGSRMGPEPYLSPIADVSCCPGQSWTVPPDKLFVMGDNRTNSSDSRTSLGFIPISKVVGRAFVIIWPPSRIHWLSTPKYSL